MVLVAGRGVRGRRRGCQSPALCLWTRAHCRRDHSLQEAAPACEHTLRGTGRTPGGAAEPLKTATRLRIRDKIELFGVFWIIAFLVQNACCCSTRSKVRRSWRRQGWWRGLRLWCSVLCNNMHYLSPVCSGIYHGMSVNKVQKRKKNHNCKPFKICHIIVDVFSYTCAPFPNHCK